MDTAGRAAENKIRFGGVWIYPQATPSGVKKRVSGRLDVGYSIIEMRLRWLARIHFLAMTIRSVVFWLWRSDWEDGAAREA